MSIQQVEAKHFKKGSYIMIDDVACSVNDNAKSAPGKHGHLKCKIDATGIIDGKKRIIMRPGDAKVPAPIIDKRSGQIVSIDKNEAQVMDLESYDMFYAPIPEEIRAEVKEGVEVEYWVIADSKSIMKLK